MVDRFYLASLINFRFYLASLINFRFYLASLINFRFYLASLINMTKKYGFGIGDCWSNFRVIGEENLKPKCILLFLI